MKKVLIAFFSLTAILKVSAQSDEALVRKIADQIITETKLGFEGTESKQFYASSKAIPENTKVKYATPYTGWHYTHGVLNMAMINLGNYLNEPRYTNYAAQHVAFGFDGIALEEA